MQRFEKKGKMHSLLRGSTRNLDKKKQFFVHEKLFKRRKKDKTVQKGASKV